MIPDLPLAAGLLGPGMPSVYASESCCEATGGFSGFEGLRGFWGLENLEEEGLPDCLSSWLSSSSSSWIGLALVRLPFPSLHHGSGLVAGCVLCMHAPLACLLCAHHLADPSAFTAANCCFQDILLSGPAWLTEGLVRGWPFHWPGHASRITVVAV